MDLGGGSRDILWHEWKGVDDQELFRHWLKDHFVPNAVPGHPLLLILDGHSSHYEPVIIELARKEKVILFCLPPHTTQDSQPLDCTVFRPLKHHWSGVCHDFQQAHPGMVISKPNFSKLFAEAWLQAVTPANIIAGFRKCGIHPFNHNAIPILEEVHHIDVDAEDELKHDGMDDEPRDNEVEEQQFTYDQISLFQRRYEEGFDIFEDEDYVTWLRLNHPEAVPSDHSSLRAPTSVLDEFSDISPLDKIQLSVMEPSTSTSALTPPTVSSVMESSTSTSALTPPTASSVMEPSTSTSALTPPTASSITDPSTSTSTSAGTSAMDFSSASGITTPLSSKHGDTQAKMKKVSPVVKYLQMPTISKTKTPPALSKNRAVTGARVLTSAQCLQFIKEKEMKKQLEEEKEKRRKEREAKKKESRRTRT